MSSIVRRRPCDAEAPRHGSLLHRVAASAPAVLVALWASAASAEVLLWSAYNSEQAFDAEPGAAGAGFVDFNGPASGGTLLTFSTTQTNQRVVITFTATCEPHAINIARVRILVNPAGSGPEFRAPPTDEGGGVFLCMNDGESLPQDFRTRTSVQVSARPSLASSHTVRVSVNWDSGLFILEDASLSVMR